MPDLMTADPELLRIWDELAKRRGAPLPSEAGGMMPQGPQASVRSLTSPVGDWLSQYVSPTTAYKIDQAGQAASAMSPPAQFNRATDAVATAIDKPTLPNITDAGVQTAMTVGRPLFAAGTLATGMGGAILGDLMGNGSAKAEDSSDPLTPDMRKRYDALQKKSRRTDLSDAETAELGTFNKIIADVVTRRATVGAAADEEKRKNEEAQRAADAKRKADEEAGMRDRARQAYQAGLATDRRFGDTLTGQMFDKFGPLAPGAVAAGTGAVTGAGLRGAGVTSKAGLYGVPIALGSFVGGASAHWPMIYDSNYAPIVNPSYQAAENYIREAPPNDPRAAQLKDLMASGSLTKENLTRTEAEKSLYDPTKFKERTLLGVLEGGPGGLAGSEIWPAMKYLTRSAPKAAYEVGRIPGATLGGLTESTGEAVGKARAGYEKGNTERLKAARENAITQAEIDAALAEARIRAAAGARDQELARPAPPVPVQIPEPAAAAPVATLKSAAERARRYLNGR